jgi:Tol biopolymer transport system component
MFGTTGRAALAALLLLVVGASTAHAQYFGRNKVQYRTFKFEILKTEHFDLYFYPEEAAAARIAARMAERWHERLSRFFGHELRGRQAVILYAVPAHFRQTNAIEGLIGEGTGGATEAMKRRIVLPMSGSLSDTDHVLGHELVHAFQFDLTGDDPRESTASMPDILQYPLWFVEGMAEYLTLGAVDGQTAMWLRDAALREKLPHIRDLDSPQYFPYRWGHAFWAFVGAKHGDRAVASLIRSAANPRFDLPGLSRQLGSDPDTLTAAWHQAIREAAHAVVADASPIVSQARRLIDRRTGGGRFNIGPRLSPDGGEIAFFSERDRFSVELFIADAETGRIKRRLSQSATDPHFDSLEFLNSAGAWSPDGRTLAIAAMRGGRPVVACLDPGSGRVQREWALPGLDDALNPAFSPDGRSVVVAGNAGGLLDLYVLSFDSGRLERLTDDPFADLEPVFTPDGRAIVFVTERFSTSLESLEPGKSRLATIDLASRVVRPIPGFRGGKHLSPQVSADGRFVTFLGDPDGITNVYRMPIDGGPIVRLTSVLTGVAGITAGSPALTASPATGRLAYSVFEDDGHTLYVLDPAQVVAHVAPDANAQAALLPGRTTAVGDVQRLIGDAGRGLPAIGARIDAVPYTHALMLDGIGQPTLSAGISEFGGFVGGSVSAYFSDMLGDRMLGLVAQAGGSFADLGGQAVYLNRRHRWNWAAAVEQMPSRLGYLTLSEDPAAGEIHLTEVILRQTSRGAFGVTAFPFSVATRVELAGGIRSLTFTREDRVRVFSSTTQEFLERRAGVKTVAPRMNLAEGSVALVRDTSFFGATSPVYGSRGRIEVGQSLGTLHYASVLVDGRRYFMPARPVTIAVRGLHYGRYGRNSQHDQLLDLYAGHQEFVHGYGYGSFTAAECPDRTPAAQCPVFANLLGSRLLVANLEVRAPLVGLFKGEIEYGRVPIEVAAFFDAGVTWSRDSRPSFLGGSKQVVRSAGAAARVNLFGLLVLEVAASRPFDRMSKSWRWQIGVRQGF